MPENSVGRHYLSAVLLFGLIALNTGAARAGEEPPEVDAPYEGLDHTGTPPPCPRECSLPPQSAEPGQKRKMPDYDGREGECASAGESLIWIPRVVFFPVYVVMEYVVRWPIYQAIAFIEEYHVIPRVVRFFTFGDGQGALVPTIFYDFGLNPSMGLYFFYDNLGVKNHNLVLQAGFWPMDYYHFILRDNFKVFRYNRGTVSTRAEYMDRPDKVFYGLGPDSRDARRFFRLEKIEAELNLRAALQDLNRLTFGMMFTNARISGGQGPSIDSTDSPFDVTDAEIVPGFGSTYNLLVPFLRLELDSRSPDRVFTPGSGLRLDAAVSFHIDPNNPDLHFLRYGGEACAYLDISGLNHVLALRVYLESLEVTGDAAVPLTERISLGGAENLRGFLGGRFRGDSALVVTADYRYPIHTKLDANLFLSIGNVARGRLDQLDLNKMAMVWGIGVRTNTSRDVSFDIMVGFGTNLMQEWDEKFKVDNVRFIVGINQGF